MIDSSQRLQKSQVNTEKPLRFYFDGKQYQGYEGDTLASALLANGIVIIGRSFKLHRPRGIFSAGKEEVNAFVQLEKGAWTEPNIRATIQPLYQDLNAWSQHAWPNARYDISAFMQFLKPFLPAGFYYKTFKWPNWDWWESFVRKMAGLGNPPKEKDPHRYHKHNCHTDVLIVGAGPAGLSAALTVSHDNNLRVLLVNEQGNWGGSLLSNREIINNNNALNWVSQAVKELSIRKNVTLLGRTTVIGYYDHNVLSAVEEISLTPPLLKKNDMPRQRLWKIRAKQVILTTGAIERPLVFPDNDRPRIMLANAISQYVHRYGIMLSKKLVFYTNNDSVYANALALMEVGIGVLAIIDVRHQVNAALRKAIDDKGIKHFPGYAISATYGFRSVKKVKLNKLNHTGNALISESLMLKCDLLGISGGWTPTVHLFSQSGGKLKFDETLSCFIPIKSVQHCVVAGSATGMFSTMTSIKSANKAAHQVLDNLGVTGTTDPLTNVESEDSKFSIQSFWMTPDVSTNHQWVDFQYDVTASDIALAARENFISVEHFKRYTTTGMSIDQGKTSNVNALAILGIETQRQISEVGTTKFRPPYHPTTIGVFAGRQLGRLYRPFQMLPAHHCHLEHGGKMIDFGGWLRAEYYPRDKETEEQTISREVLSVRNNVGLLDYSPLGKIELRGPDAREFLNRIYINNILTLKVGAARYGLLLNEKGIVIDDGVMVCLAEDHFLIHTTSGGATTIHQALEEWLQCEWIDLEVLVTNNTTQWATLLLSGPFARNVIEKLDSDIDFGRDAFPHMKFQTGSLMSVPTRILRTSFTGEISYEISVPANYGHSLWQALMESGNEFDITPFGIESLMVMRTEKGFLHVGQDTDGTTMPQDLGWAGAISKQQTDFVGRRSLTTQQGQANNRLQFVGIEPIDPKVELLSGAHILASTKGAKKHVSGGYVTSAFKSPTLDKTVALGLVANGRNRIGETVNIFLNNSTIPAKLINPGVYDPKGDVANG